MSEWIKCSERLPSKKDERNRSSLIWVITHSKCGIVEAIAFDPKKQIFTDYCDNGWVNLSESITHWMPLPAAPEAE